MSAILNAFYPIVDTTQWLKRLLPLGAKLVQLRIKNKSADEIKKEIRLAKALCAQYEAQLIVNDYWQLAIEEQCDFVHLGQEDLQVADISAIHASGLKLGISTHNLDELRRALEVNPTYVALGPIYPTLIKTMPWKPQGVDRITEWKRLIGHIPLVAIGGITVERLPLIFAAGADSAAVITDIVGHVDPEARVSEWINASAIATQGRLVTKIYQSGCSQMTASAL